MIAATLQLCTFNRAALLDRVLEACFDQDVDPAVLEVVLVDDGSSDETPTVIERWRERATCAFTAIRQPNGGLARARNAGIERARGERIAFIDDDVIVLPNFVREHLRSGDAHPGTIVRGGAIEVTAVDDLPPPVWSIVNYSGNYFWTTNVSVPLRTLREVGAFNESFAEYGWEDIDVGLRLRAAGVKAVFNARALVYHVKPRPRTTGVERMIRQARAQARTAVALVRLHPNWRAHLATGINPVQRRYAGLRRALGYAGRFRARLEGLSDDRELSSGELRAARALANEAYFDELERALAPG